MLFQSIKTVIFDLDGTLRFNFPSADDVQYKIALTLGVEDAPGKQRKGARWAHYYWAQSSELVIDLAEYGDMNIEFWINYSCRYLNSLGIADNKSSVLAPKLYRLMEEKFLPEDKVYPHVHETLQRIKDHDFTFGLVSNRSNPCQEQCEELGLLNYFDFAYVAAEVNAWKPDPHIFDRALEISGNLPEEIIYIGDNYYADIVGARNANLYPILFDPNSLFPDMDCTTIHSIQELIPLLLN